MNLRRSSSVFNTFTCYITYVHHVRPDHSSEPWSAADNLLWLIHEGGYRHLLWILRRRPSLVPDKNCKYHHHCRTSRSLTEDLQRITEEHAYRLPAVTLRRVGVRRSYCASSFLIKLRPFNGDALLPWDNLSFVAKEKVTCGAVGYPNWITTSLHQISTDLYIPTAEAIDASLASDWEVDLLETVSSEDAGVDAVHVHKTIYLLVPYVSMFLERNLTTSKAWSQLWGSIVDAGGEVYCQTIINWLQVVLTQKSRDAHQPPLAMPRPMPPLINGDICDTVTIYLSAIYPGTTPALQRAKVSFIAMHIKEVAVDLLQER